ncbi:OmpA family protein [Myxococcota bacterium]|nr:OmpA family protein [Myxococcota bacterium]
MRAQALAASSCLLAAALVAPPVAAAPWAIPGIKPRSVLVEAYGGYHLFLQVEENFQNNGVVGGRIGVNVTDVFGFELGVGYMQTPTHYQLDDDKEGKLTHVLNPRIDMTFHLARWPAVPYFQFGAGLKHFLITERRSEEAVKVDDLGDVLPQPKNPDTDFEVDVSFGVRLLATSRLGLDLNARYLMSVGPGEVFTRDDGSVAYQDRFDNLEFTAGIFGVIGGPPDDRDGDGIIDRLDQCREDPEDRDGWEDEDGCPEWDNDGDGIADVEDGCRDVPEDPDGFEDADGCPDDDNDLDGVLDGDDRCPAQPEDEDGWEDEDGCPELDNDGDGIADHDDRCPTLPENFNDYEDIDGCPDEGDRDGDGILDKDDDCPERPEDDDGFEDVDGCPEADNDGDGVVDPRDTCPNDPEVPNGYQDLDGCPDEVPQDLTRFIGVIRGIHFKLDSDEILATSFPILNEAADVLLRYPAIRVEVQGHASADGDDEHNLDLSQRRAESVMRYLAGRGVELDRLLAVGYGETRPIADDSADGRVLNRRVEFHIVPPSPPPGDGGAGGVRSR